MFSQRLLVVLLPRPFLSVHFSMDLSSDCCHVSSTRSLPSRSHPSPPHSIWFFVCCSVFPEYAIRFIYSLLSRVGVGCCCCLCLYFSIYLSFARRLLECMDTYITYAILSHFYVVHSSVFFCAIVVLFCRRAVIFNSSVPSLIHISRLNGCPSP